MGVSLGLGRSVLRMLFFYGGQMNFRRSFQNMTRFERRLWLLSMGVITLSFLLSPDFDLLTLLASLVGATSVILVARGDVLGELIGVLFSILYAVISYRFRYYGEMITYLGMTGPLGVIATIAWLRHPYKEQEVRVAALRPIHVASIILLAAAVTAAFYFILRHFNTANLALSTVSITTSVVAVYLSACRSSYYALGYAANDVVLILLWVLATLEDGAYLPMVFCFVMFLFNDLYAFFNWRRIYRRQQAGE